MEDRSHNQIFIFSALLACFCFFLAQPAHVCPVIKEDQRHVGIYVFELLKHGG